MDKLSFGDVIPAADDRTVLTVQSDGVIQDSDMDGDCDVSVGVESNTSADESLRLSIERWIRRHSLSLVHASHCRHADCIKPSCYKMKRVIHHAKGCKTQFIKLSNTGFNMRQTTDDNCLVCKPLIEMCFIHSKRCRQIKCPVPHCVTIKLKLRQRQRREAHKLKRRIATKQTSTVTTTSTATHRASAQIDAIVAQVNSISLNLHQ